jgi:2-hydroxy-6-oxonona-2,4-dienedioate hydrolase
MHPSPGKAEQLWTWSGQTCFHARAARGAPQGAPRVVLLHSLGASSRTTLPTLVHLAPFCHVYAPDLPGFGLSSKPRRVLDLNELADALALWLQAAGIGKTSLLASSTGCQPAIRFAVRHPERLERLILVGPTHEPCARTAPQQVLRWLRNSPREPLTLGPVLLLDYMNAGLRRVLRTFAFALQERIETFLPEIRAPTLVVRGARDPLVPEWWAREVTERIPQGRLVLIPRAAHMVSYDAPLELTRVVRPFLGLQDA